MSKAVEESAPGTAQIVDELSEEVDSVANHVFLNCHTDIHLIAVIGRILHWLRGIHPNLFDKESARWDKIFYSCFSQAVVECEERLEWWEGRKKHFKEKEEVLGLRDEQTDSDQDAGPSESAGETGDDPVCS